MVTSPAAFIENNMPSVKEEERRDHGQGPAVGRGLEVGLQWAHVLTCTSSALPCEGPGGRQLTPPNLSFFMGRMWRMPLLSNGI